MAGLSLDIEQSISNCVEAGDLGATIEEARQRAIAAQLVADYGGFSNIQMELERLQNERAVLLRPDASHLAKPIRG
ncbi:hypothetical protein A3D00_04485 [Candidatus Woesebacteria bacterium RIFCSPHIGHO2_02_FULL_38_9]|uniref:Uncharacterized protein n=1 Tax=Candidatus Woesebacteria bacterium RIFCSPHIGHO2_01_FULL_39_28 TaxID=1802496 RepID=A0A1F7YGB5_9BACT|nr:MAG: hypothetical protein A2627_05840 [Candidatus Woesebacteria bacterium RIFCSPHIGHO2_01_FULL_39_28]OGM34948.1 MAG: hypothetical protein A3D00_04485 [Candidatus Woesebacteria bacterium RIFCSPHIGHO2_02_FULL_38_9]OGM57449.1 MAG: hypothetical protein A3A50_05965 [Candidatus Woesebacteria bacterium RIFCSPLOWO2_01_FULL_38_20]